VIIQSFFAHYPNDHELGIPININGGNLKILC